MTWRQNSTAVLPLRTLVCLGLLLGASLPATALELPGEGQWRTQVRGFAAQGAAKSWGNNFIGDSIDGSFAYYELGLNATAELGPLSVAAQGLLRRVGETDRAGPRLDFGFVDYHPFDSVDFQGGLRYGRVKNPYGLFNDTRDVIFARPSVLLPNSVYYDISGGGLRNLLFSSDGGQLYGAWNVGDHYLTLVATSALERDFTAEEVRNLFGQAGFDVTLDSLTVGRVMDEWAGGTWRAAASVLSGTLTFDSQFLSGELDYDSYVLSLEHRGERYSVVGEYVVTRTDATGFGKQTGDGFYVQGDYRFGRDWALLLRYDAQYADRDDRSGRRYAAENPGADRYSRFSRDYVIGLNWRPDARWGVWLEQHFVRGSSAVPAAENRDRAVDSDSELLLMMIGYHF